MVELRAQNRSKVSLTIHQVQIHISAPLPAQSHALRIMSSSEDEIPEIITVEGNEASAKVEVVNQWPGRWSEVWKEFNRINPEDSHDGLLRSQCKHCKTGSAKAESVIGTKNQTKHLGKCAAYQASLKKEGGKVSFFDQKIYRELVAQAIIKHGYSYSLVEHEGNRKIHEYLNAKVKCISRNTAKADCMKIYNCRKNLLKTILKRAPGRICLTCDMWTSCLSEGYLCLTAHFVDENWKLNSKVLNFRHVPPPHSGQDIYKVVIQLVKEWGIDDKLFSLTLDNASSNDKMQTHMIKRLNDWGYLLNCGAYFHVRCAAHVLNLIVKDGLKVIESVVAKIRESVKHVKGSEARKIYFRKVVDLCRINETKSLWLDVATRWNSTFMMLDRALLYKDAFMNLHTEDVTYMQCPEPHEWDMVEKIRDALEPFNDITELFSGSEYPTANLYFQNVWNISMLLKDVVLSNDNILRMMAVEMQIKFDKYWGDSGEDNYTTLFAFAIILDPRCKLEFLTYCYKKLFSGDEARAMDKVHSVSFKLEKLFDEYTSKQSGRLSSSSKTKQKSNTKVPGSRKRKCNYSDDFDAEERNEKSELKVYLDESRVPKSSELDVLQYWKEHEKIYGVLSHMARDILTVPLTTVASESTFSIRGRILNKWRNSFIPENVETLITTRSWLHGYECMDEEEVTGCHVEWK